MKAAVGLISFIHWEDREGLSQCVSLSSKPETLEKALSFYFFFFFF